VTEIDPKDITKKFYFNPKRFKITRGKEFFVNGEVIFPKTSSVDVKRDGSYRTRMGALVAIFALIYGNSNHNVRYALRRLLSSRWPIISTMDEIYFAAQAKFIAQHADILLAMAARYAEYFHKYDGMAHEAWIHAGDPHIKKDIRIAAQKTLEEDATEFDRLWLKWVWYKMKKDEYARFGKYPRMIGDLGVAASLQGFRLTYLLKTAQACEPLEHHGVQIEFIKSPDPFILEETFRKLIDPPGKGYFCYFSDDSCASMRDSSGKVHTFNVDISSCDASHTTALFNCLLSLIPPSHRDDAKRLVEQCELPIRVYDIGNRRQYVVITPDGPRLYSGSTLTTAINGLASMLIGIAIAESGACTAKDVRRAAARVGYVVTCDENSDYSKLQFLKNSPVYDTNGKLRPILNLGVLLRASGTCRGEAPLKGLSMKERFESFQHGLLLGAYPHAQFRLLHNMKAMVQHATPTFTDEFVHKVARNDAYPSFHVSDEELYKRYDLDTSGVADVNLLGFCGFEQELGNPGLSKILKDDYGLSCRFLFQD
jgi:hypothetical protein